MSIVKKLGDIEKKINAYGNQINRITELLEKNQEFLKVLLANQLLDEMDVQSGNSIEKRSSEVSKVSDPYSPENFIDRGDYIELVTPLVVVDENCKRSYIKAIQKDDFRMDFDRAQEHARILCLGGFNDWRVPTKDELYEIYKIKNVCGINKYEFFFWSSSTRDNIGCSWGVNFYDGSVSLRNKTRNYTVCCVR